jgi:S1-C subfamily serine protease
MVPVSSQLANALDLGRPAGAMISEVARGSPAAEAGLRRGDVILLFDRAPIRDVEDFEDKIRAAGPGKHVKLDVWRIRPKGVDSFSTDLTTPPASGTEAQFQQLRRTIDAHNQEAKSIIDSMGR